MPSELYLTSCLPAPETLVTIASIIVCRPEFTEALLLLKGENILFFSALSFHQVQLTSSLALPPEKEVFESASLKVWYSSSKSTKVIGVFPKAPPCSCVNVTVSFASVVVLLSANIDPL